MENTNCSKCNKNPAVVYITKMEKGKSVKEGVCLKCGCALKLKPVEDFIKRTNLSTDEFNYHNEELADESVNNSPSVAKSVKRRRYLEKYCESLAQKAAAGKIDHVVGREIETERVMQILSRRQKSNPCLIGEPGVGKTAIAEGLALRIHKGNIPQCLRDKEIFSLNMSVLEADATHVGVFGERLHGVLKDVQEHGNAILFIDEIHTLVGAGSHRDNSADAADAFKPALARGELQVIGATTIDEYRTYIESDAALERRLQPVKIDEPSVEEAINIVKGIKGYYETFHNVKISDEMAKASVKLSDKYITDRFLPDKAIDLIDEACANLNLNRKPGKKRNPELSKDNLARVIELWTKIPACSIGTDERENLSGLDERIKENVIGQDIAIDKVCAAIKRKRLGISGKRKPASFIFIGSTGIGKTEVVKQLAMNLFGKKESIVRLDMSEYMEKHSFAKIIGSPPGYVGYEEAGQLTEKILREPYSIVLLDEIEKAHPNVMNIFLQILDEGHITDSRGRRVDFKNTIIIMTSNAGNVDKTVGFNKSADDCTKEAGDRALKNFLKPEFINRVDEVIHFSHLTDENIKTIARLMLGELCDSLSEMPVSLNYDDNVVDYLMEKTDSKTYGARDLYRLIQSEIEDKIAAEMLADCDASITVIDLSVFENTIKVKVK